jgi:hypothetical protein
MNKKIIYIGQQNYVKVINNLSQQEQHDFVNIITLSSNVPLALMQQLQISQ